MDIKDKVNYHDLKVQHDNKLFKKFFYHKDFSKSKYVLSEMPGYLEYLKKKDRYKVDSVLNMEICPNLSKEQEFHLFRKYNYLKCRCNEIFKKYDYTNINVKNYNLLLKYLKLLKEVKDSIIPSYIKLALSLSRNAFNKDSRVMASSSVDVSLSDAFCGLVYAIDKFDYTMGYRFTTYAYYTMKDYIRKSFADEYKYNDQFKASMDKGFEEIPACVDHNLENNERKSSIQTLLQDMSDRERNILSYYYGLEGRQLNFIEISNELKIKKERVRRIHSAALSKLRGQFCLN